MNRHLAEVDVQVHEGGHPAVVLDGAGWYRSKDLEIPNGVSLLRHPPLSPELNWMGKVFGHLKSNKLANRLLDTVEDAREAVLEAWTEFAGPPDRIASIMN
ncbi:MAG: hypothetical protein OXI87_02770 [Albidovulum sp.]|nr:hypothetical protein [Albidovulum sp.]